MTEARAWGWVAHLRAGGTTPWAAWSTPGEATATVIPGAQQLELLRHLNLAATTASSTELADRVLTASAPGRGRPDLELDGAVVPSRFGPRPVDPGTLPVDELVRVATGLLADDLVTAGREVPEPQVDRAGRYLPHPHEARRPRRWRPAYVLGGDPWLADPARARLIETGRPPGGRDAVAVLVGTDLATMLVDAWTARCFGEGAPPWREFLAHQVRAGQLAPRADLARAARTRAAEHDEVAVVLDPRLLPRLVGTRRPLPQRPRPPAHAVELARRTGPALRLLATAPRATQLLVEVLLPRLADVAGDPLVLPSGRQRWVQRQARRQQRELAGRGYAVHGDLDLLLPRGHTGVPEPSEPAVLDLALRLLLQSERPATRAKGRR